MPKLAASEAADSAARSRRGGPAAWSADELRTWLAEQPFAACVALPDGATGASLMKLPIVRLQQGACGGDKEAAQALFDALRAAAYAARSTRLPPHVAVPELGCHASSGPSLAGSGRLDTS